MNKNILAYTAGIIDGEGSLGIGRKLSHGRIIYSPIVEVTMVDPLVPVFLKQTFGGYILTRKRQYLNPKYRDATMWGMSGCFNIISFLEQVRPFLIQKKQEADLLSLFCDQRKNVLRTKPRNMAYTPEQISIYEKLKLIHRPMTAIKVI